MQLYLPEFVLKLPWKLDSPYFTLPGNNSEVYRFMFAFPQNTFIDEAIFSVFQFCLQKQNGISFHLFVDKNIRY